jgi:hypothetical protein
MLEKQRVITKSLLKDNSQIEIKKARYLSGLFFDLLLLGLSFGVKGFQEQLKNNNLIKKAFVFVPVLIYRYQKLIDV